MPAPASTIPALGAFTIKSVLKESAVYVVEAGTTGAKARYVLKSDGINAKRARGGDAFGDTTKEEATKSIAFLLRVYRAVCTTLPAMRMLTDTEEKKFHELEARYCKAVGKEPDPRLREKTKAVYAMRMIEGLWDLGDVDSIRRPDRRPEVDDLGARAARARGGTVSGPIQKHTPAGRVGWLFGFLNQDPSLFFELGRILVADIYGGHGDRFSIAGDAGNPVVSVTNWGNLFFLVDSKGEKAQMCGLDIVDPSSMLSNLFGILTAQREMNEWYPQFLVESGSAARATLARAVMAMLKRVASEELGLGARFQPGADHEAALTSGLALGCVALQSFWSSVKREWSLPRAAKERFSQLRY